MEIYILIAALVFMVISKMDFLRKFRLSIHPIVYFLISVFLFGIIGGILLGKHVLKDDEDIDVDKKTTDKKIVNKNINNGFNKNIFDKKVHQVIVS